MKNRYIGMIADHPTPKITEGVAFTMNNRDYKGVMIIVLSDEDGADNGEQPSRELLRTGCVQRHAGDGSW